MCTTMGEHWTQYMRNTTLKATRDHPIAPDSSIKGVALLIRGLVPPLGRLVPLVWGLCLHWLWRSTWGRLQCVVFVVCNVYFE